MKKVTIEQLGEDLNLRIQKIKKDEENIRLKLLELEDREKRVAYREKNCDRRELIIFRRKLDE